MELPPAVVTDRGSAGIGRIAAAGAVGVSLLTWATWNRRDRALVERTRARLA